MLECLLFTVCSFFFFFIFSPQKMNSDKANMTEGAKGKTRCFLCGRNHAICYCLTFRRMLCEERRQALQGQPICLNCLGFGHKRDDCSSVNRCTTCSRKHHTMLHRAPAYAGASSEENLAAQSVPRAAKPKVTRPTVEADFKRLTLGEGTELATSLGFLMYPVLTVCPVIECVLRAGDRQRKVTLMVFEEIPKSQLRFNLMEFLKYPTKFKNNTAYGQFKIALPDGGYLDEWFIMVDKLQAKIEPSITSHDLHFCLQKVGPLAHPEPHLYLKVHGIMGRDLA